MFELLGLSVKCYCCGVCISAVLYEHVYVKIVYK